MIKECVMCGSHSMIRHTDTFRVNLAGTMLSVEDVLSYKCQHCGEIYYPQSSALYIEEQIKLKGIDDNE